MPSTEIMLTDRTRAAVWIEGQTVLVEREGASRRRLTSHREVLDFTGPKTLRDAVLRAWESVRVGRDEVPTDPGVTWSGKLTVAMRAALLRIDNGLPLNGTDAQSARRLQAKGLVEHGSAGWWLTEAGQVELHGRAS